MSQLDQESCEGGSTPVQIPKGLLNDAIQEAAFALEGDSNDREHDALVFLRAELESWANQDPSVAEVASHV